MVQEDVDEEKKEIRNIYFNNCNYVFMDKT